LVFVTEPRTIRPDLPEVHSVTSRFRKFPHSSITSSSSNIFEDPANIFSLIISKQQPSPSVPLAHLRDAKTDLLIKSETLRAIRQGCKAASVFLSMPIKY
jgi:hypothetical protein